jgi:hypothetical protein
MQWSKLKTRIREFICPELSNRVDFHLTSYRESHDGADKVWITVDGLRVLSCKHYRHEWARLDAYYDGLRGEQIESLLRGKEIHSPNDFGDAMRAYLDLPIGDALKSGNPLIKAFAIIDRRVGRRTLEKLEIDDSEHSLVKTFYELRLAAMPI